MLQKEIPDNVEDGSTVMTDENPVYESVEAQHEHETVKHWLGEYD